MKNSKDSNAIIESEIEVNVSYYGVLAGLIFAASIFAFQFRTTFPFGDIFLTFTLVTTILFIFAATASALGSGRMRHADKTGAMRFLELSDNFGAAAIFMLFADVVIFAFAIGLLYGLVVSAITITGFLLLFRITPS